LGEPSGRARADPSGVRRALAITAAVAAVLLAAGLPAGSIGAGGRAQSSAGQRWLGPSRLETDHGRLKQVPLARPLPAPVENAWRQPAEAGDVTSRENVWRTQVIRPQVQQPAAAPPAPQPPAAGDYDAAVVAATNDIRRSHGLSPLKVSAKLGAAADQHSTDMGRRGYFAHESADGSAFWKRVQQFYPQGDASYWAVGENLIWSSPELSVDGAMKGWMESPGHRDNILGKEWREIGCGSVQLDSAPGVYGGRKVVIITCDFGVRR
jgi:uncharacterized protein YkwD